MKLLQSGTKGALKSFRSVQFSGMQTTFLSRMSNNSSSLDGSAPPTTVKARKEVILSAGSIGTAQILQLSGIGNADDLKALNISVLIDNPGVGANLIDHLLVPNIFNVKGDESSDKLLRNSSLLKAAMDQWTANKTGIVGNSLANTYGFARLPSNSSIFKTVADPAAGPKSPHWEVVFAVSALHLIRMSLPLGLIFVCIESMVQSRGCSTCYRKFLDFSHCPH